ncbi:unnamed protein product [Sphagnum jensenii]|uniref:Uncharacterized protein n=1 Tax=Sphagnum jensenii TaxID=128206 RepID=A0ABP0VX25_9BRYO
MADSWQKYPYEAHKAIAVGPLTSEIQLLDVLVKTKGSNPILHNVGSIVNLGSKASQKTADPLRNALKHLESNEDDKLYKEQWLGPIEHTVNSRASLKSSLRIFGDAAKLDLDGDKYLQCKLERVQLTSINREELTKFISHGDWKPDVDKLKKLKHWSEPSRGVLNCFRESVQDLWVIYEILKAKKVSLASADSHSGAVGADVTALLPVGGPPVRGNLSVSATKKTEFKFTVPNNKVRAFGFRAIHAQYDSTGELISFVHNEGSPIGLQRRDPPVSMNSDPRLDFGGLFLKPPGDIQDDNGEDLECLEIVVNNLGDELDK